jgi:hypothetical protein
MAVPDERRRVQSRWGEADPGVSILELLDELPEAVARPPSRLWSVFARSLGEQGADGRTALAWRWALTGACPSPVTLARSLGRPPGRGELLAEAGASAELAAPGIDRGGQVLHARFVLQWLAGEIEALPLWNGGPLDPQVTDGAESPRTRAALDEVYFWAQLAKFRNPWPAVTVPSDQHLPAWALGASELLAWTCGEAADGPLSGLRIPGRRPKLREISLDACRAMTGVGLARDADDPARVTRLEAVMETFLWLTGWHASPPVDRHGHCAFENCPEREAPCGCGAAGCCLRGECLACWRVACVHGFGDDV